MRRPGSEDPHRRDWNFGYQIIFYNILILNTFLMITANNIQPYCADNPMIKLTDSSLNMVSIMMSYNNTQVYFNK